MFLEVNTLQGVIFFIVYAWKLWHDGWEIFFSTLLRLWYTMGNFKKWFAFACLVEGQRGREVSFFGLMVCSSQWFIWFLDHGWNGIGSHGGWYFFKFVEKSKGNYESDGFEIWFGFNLSFSSFDNVDELSRRILLLAIVSMKKLLFLKSTLALSVEI